MDVREPNRAELRDGLRTANAVMAIDNNFIALPFIDLVSTREQFAERNQSGAGSATKACSSGWRTSSRRGGLGKRNCAASSGGVIEDHPRKRNQTTTATGNIRIRRTKQPDFLDRAKRSG